MFYAFVEHVVSLSFYKVPSLYLFKIWFVFKSSIAIVFKIYRTVEIFSEVGHFTGHLRANSASRHCDFCTRFNEFVLPSFLRQSSSSVAIQKKITTESFLETNPLRSHASFSLNSVQLFLLSFLLMLLC